MFKQNFPSLGSNHGTATSSATASQTNTSLGGIPAGAGSAHQRSFDDHNVPKDNNELTPRGGTDPWRFTPNLLDNSFSFASFANQGPGYYTPGGLNSVYHNQSAGDLHTPGMAFHLGTPLSMPMADGMLQAPSPFDVNPFNSQLFQNHHFQNNQPFQAPQQTYAPSLLVHQDSGYGPMEGSPDNDHDMSSGHRRESQMGLPLSHGMGASMGVPPPPPTEQ